MRQQIAALLATAGVSGRETQNPVVTGAMESTSPDLGEVASMLEDMQKGIQQLHDEDASLYEKEACHCEEETSNLAEPGKGVIPLAVLAINEASQTIKEKTALKKDEEEDLATNTEELAAVRKLEKEQSTAWAKRKAELEANIAESTQAANALAGATQKLQSEKHASILKLVEDMMTETKDTLKTYNTEKSTEQTARDDQNVANIKTEADEKEQIRLGEESIADCKEKIGKAKTKLLDNEGELKDAHQQLADLTAFCEAQAGDWDKMSAERKKDFGVLEVAINVLTCGKEKCGVAPDETNFAQVSFLQTSKKAAFLAKFSQKNRSHMKKLQQSDSAKRNAVRSLVRFGEQNGMSELLQFKSVLKNQKDPLLGAKNLLRKLIEKLTTEMALDQGEMNKCSTALAECTTKRDFALEEVSKLKVEAEELGLSVEEDKKEFGEQAVEYKENQDNANEKTEVVIPEMEEAYATEKQELTKQKTWLHQAVVILRKHFGIEENDLRSGSKDSASGLTEGVTEKSTSAGRKVNNQGQTQSMGQTVVHMLNDFLEQRTAELKGLREAHIKALAGERKLKQDLSATAGAAKSRTEYLLATIEKETAEFNEKIEELQARLDAAAVNGRCVQKLEPCGVQTDMRAKREAEMKALKEAWDKLAEGTEAVRPATWE
ncbi:unnamed protein product [Amoebophrya sp. A120]|nr:unnamed protein product [Amoebophrya sp. A120]|eukprot:GSA120T00003304001.1